MCRMLGIVTKTKTEPKIFDQFAQQCKTGCVLSTHKEPGHMDGWGLSFFQDNRMEVVKSGKDARSDELYQKTYSLILDSPIVVGHLRKATDSETKGVADFAHPFAKEGWVFAHNGSVHWKPEVKSLYPNLIDSQIVLERILDNIRGEEDYLDKIAKTIRDIVEGEKLSALNFLLTNGKVLICYRFFDEAQAENQKYYTLYKKVTQERVLIASEPVEALSPGWTLLEPGELLTVEKDLSVKSKVLHFEMARK